MTTIYQVDAFTKVPFGGNPAAVVVFDVWPSDTLLQHIAEENNLAETAFVIPKPNATGNDYELRWFTPAVEVPLCGHATLASAFVLTTHLRSSLHDPAGTLHFHTRRSGVLHVDQHADGSLEMDFPSLEGVACPQMLDRIGAALGVTPLGILAARVGDSIIYLAELPKEQDVAGLRPDMVALKAIGEFGVIASAPGERVDFVSRFFAPNVGIDEDPVTGGAHCVLTPFWAGRLGRNALDARQISKRGGELKVELRGDRVSIRGHVADYMVGQINDSALG